MMHDNEVARLSDEAKAKLRGCETPEEIVALAQEEGYELSDEELKSVSGGDWLGDCNRCFKHECFGYDYNIGE